MQRNISVLTVRVDLSREELEALHSVALLMQGERGGNIFPASTSGPMIALGNMAKAVLEHIQHKEKGEEI